MSLDQLIAAGKKFGFVVDVRGPYPVLITGMKATVFHSRRDMLNHISVYGPLSDRRKVVPNTWRNSSLEVPWDSLDLN